MKCEIHNKMEEIIEEIKGDIKEIKKILLGNGNHGLINRISMLELKHQHWGSFISYLLNILQGIIVAYLTYKISTKL